MNLEQSTKYLQMFLNFWFNLIDDSWVNGKRFLFLDDLLFCKAKSGLVFNGDGSWELKPSIEIILWTEIPNENKDSSSIICDEQIVGKIEFHEFIDQDTKNKG